RKKEQIEKAKREEQARRRIDEHKRQLAEDERLELELLRREEQEKERRRASEIRRQTFEADVQRRKQELNDKLEKERQRRKEEEREKEIKIRTERALKEKEAKKRKAELLAKKRLLYEKERAASAERMRIMQEKRDMEERLRENLMRRIEERESKWLEKKEKEKKRHGLGGSPHSSISGSPPSPTRGYSPYDTSSSSPKRSMGYISEKKSRDPRRVVSSGDIQQGLKFSSITTRDYYYEDDDGDVDRTGYELSNDPTANIIRPGDLTSRGPTSSSSHPCLFFDASHSYCSSSCSRLTSVTEPPSPEEMIPSGAQSAPAYRISSRKPILGSIIGKKSWKKPGHLITSMPYKKKSKKFDMPDTAQPPRYLRGVLGSRWEQIDKL
ncbi:hypothetical protein ADUPG1_011430, partial [Aduncisulcus paluster]